MAAASPREGFELPCKEYLRVPYCLPAPRAQHMPPCTACFEEAAPSSHLALKTKEDTSQQGCNRGGMPGYYRHIASSATQVTVLTQSFKVCFKVFVKESATFPGKNSPLWKPVQNPRVAVPWSGPRPKLSLQIPAIFHNATRCQGHFGSWRWGTRQDGNREKGALSSLSPFHYLGSRELWEAKRRVGGLADAFYKATYCREPSWSLI